MSTPTIEYWSDENSAILKNSLIVRPFNSLTGSWTSLRVGILAALTTGSQVNITGTPRFAIGICSGSTNVMGDAVCGHFLGYRSNAAAWTWAVAGQSGSYYLHQVGQYIRRDSGSADVVSTDPITNVYFYTNRFSSSLWYGKNPYFMDITKVSNILYTCKLYSPTGTSAVTQCSIDAFLREMQSSAPAFSSVESPTWGTQTVFNMAVDESKSGSFNAVNIMWDRESPNAEMLIYAVAVAVLT